MRRHQFTLKTLLLLMALAAVGTWGFIQVKKSARLSSFATKADMAATQLRGLATIYADDSLRGWTLRPNGKHLSLSQSERNEMKEWAQDASDLAAYCEKLAAKYRRAAHAPWLSVEADNAPPQPKNADFLGGTVPVFKEETDKYGR